MQILGSCLCGKITFQVTGEIYLINHCHCSRCRKAHGAAFGTFLHVSTNGFKWLTGEKSIKSYHPLDQDKRCFCHKCGSNVPVIEEDNVIIPAGSLDSDPGIKPIVHIYTESKASWYEIADSLDKFKEHAPENWINRTLKNR